MTDALLLVAVLVSVLVIGARIGRNNQIGRDGRPWRR